MEELLKDTILTDKIYEICKDLDKPTLITLVQCLACAVNNLNRTNNFKDLYIRLLENDVPEERYDEMIDENENLYVLPSQGHLVIDSQSIVYLCDINSLLGYKYVDDLTCYFGLSNENFNPEKYEK